MFNRKTDGSYWTGASQSHFLGACDVEADDVLVGGLLNLDAGIVIGVPNLVATTTSRSNRNPLTRCKIITQDFVIGGRRNVDVGETCKS
jgi:hypothetical protein